MGITRQHNFGHRNKAYYGNINYFYLTNNVQYMRKYLKLLSNKIKMPFQFWSKATRLKLQSNKQQYKVFNVK